MFYEKQNIKNQEDYKRMLSVVGSLSNVFSDSDCPYLSYRAHENIFCKYFGATNLAREDCSVDAKFGNIGLGLKTWVGQNDQKVAEFGKVKNCYDNLTGIELVKKISEYRNDRIRVTKNIQGIDLLYYHIVKRTPGKMLIYECKFDLIDIDNISIIENKGNNNNTYFYDGQNTYHFSSSKNTLYMIFDKLILLDEFRVSIINDPYSELSNFKGIALDFSYDNKESSLLIEKIKHNQEICLPLYSMKNNAKFIPEKSGLNQWNAGGRKRDVNEIYIPFNKNDREKCIGFFPERDRVFKLHLSDGTDIDAKICQDDGKAIMSNPNKVLGKWLLRDVLEIPERTIITYEMLEKFGIDSVIFSKNDECDYNLTFASLGTYESFYGEA